MLLFLSAPLWAQTGIVNIKEFLKTCPNNDPAIAQIRADFEFRNQGVLVTNIPCTEPYNQMAPEAVSSELAILQSLRVMYYMDLGRSNYLPFTPLRLYDWVKSKIAGINFAPGASFACCQTINGKTFISGRILDTFSLGFYRDFRGISGGIAVIAHEARHVDGFAHVSCCPVGAGACDQAYNEANLSAYGIQNYLARAWLTGAINVGFFCEPSNEIIATNQNIFSQAQDGQTRFCDAKPPASPVLQISDTPGGVCSLRTITLAPNALTNAANYNSTIWPGMISTIFGSNVGSTQLTSGVVTNGVLGNTAGGTQVLYNGVPGPMIYSTQNQVSAIAPFTLLSGGVSINGQQHVYVEVNNNGKLSSILDLIVTGSSAGVFTLDRTGSGQAAAVNQDFNINGVDHPVPRGQAISIYATGLGQTSPVETDGQIVGLSEPFPRVVGNVQATVGGINAVIQYAGAAPGSVAGLTQINVIVPQSVTPGPAVPIRISYGPFNQNVTIAVSN
ncbi:MAG TPA: hypothetical protein VGP79_07335 [Bryobacteraceae bacterium]|nr:hypothetical protein [Bryobacteraceae bacterium]